MPYQHLKERMYYEEMYDRHTVEWCRWHEEPPSLTEKSQRERERLGPGQIQFCYTFVTDWFLFQLVGDRYMQREKSINEWMERDRQRDALMSRARAPLIRCPSCDRVMECLYIHLNSDVDDRKREWIEFFIGCKSYKHSKRVYENGSEIIRKPPLCIKCNREVDCDTKKKDGKTCYIDTCKHCGHVEETMSVLDEKEKEPTQEEIKRFEYDKKRFCLTTQQGERYKHWLDAMKRTDDQKKESDANIEFYDKLADVKKLNIASLEKLLKTAIKKAGYTDLHFIMPPPDRQIIVNFSLRDMKEKREPYESEKTLEKIFESVLEDKNWALMSDGAHYRLGLLSGRIRGYETEEDLQELTKSRMKKKGKHVKLTNSKSRQYASMFPDDIQF